MLNRWTIVIGALLLGCVGCGEDHVTVPATSSTTTVAQELAATGAGAYLNITPSGPATHKGDWDEYAYDPAKQDAICLRGTQYLVEVHHGTANKVLLYLEGGGACWEYVTCSSGAAKPTATASFGDGILDFNNDANPFKDWSVVYAPYCDGSVFTGNNIVDYSLAGNSIHVFHHGIQNLSAAVALLKAQYPDPEEILVSGSSAGGYGTFQGYSVTRIAFPDTTITVFDDSGPGLQNPADTTGVEDRNTNWKFLQYVPASCTDCNTQLSYLSDWAMDRDPTLRTALFSYQQDNVIRGFLMLDGPSYQALLLDTTNDIHNRHPDRFKRFFKKGIAHTVLELPGFYALTVNGTVMRDWTADFLTDGPKWQDLVEQ